MNTKQKTSIVIGTIILILVIDQFIKIWVKTNLDPYETISLISGFIELHFIENRGMAFGTEFGSGIWAKYALSTFRLAAIIGIGIYIRKIIRDKTTSFLFLIAIALVFAGATGNLIDGMIYDYLFDLDGHFKTNWVSYQEDPEIFYPEKMRETGFMLRQCG